MDKILLEHFLYAVIKGMHHHMDFNEHWCVGFFSNCAKEVNGKNTEDDHDNT